MSETINSEKAVLEDIVMPTKCEHFISEIHINQLRHLHDIEIPLSTSERKHLIFTGKNGSGKSSVLEELSWILEHDNWDKNLFGKKYEEPSSFPIQELQGKRIIYPIALSMRSLPHDIKLQNPYFIFQNDLDALFEEGHFILCHFSAQRRYDPIKPQGPNNFQPEQVVKNVSVVQNVNFIQYMVNLESQLGIALLKERNHVATTLI